MSEEPKKKGRPRLPDPNQEQELEAVISSPEPVYTEVAYSIVQLPQSWMLVRIPFDPKSGRTGAPEFEPVTGGQLDAEDRFKTVVGPELFWKDRA